MTKDAAVVQHPDLLQVGEEFWAFSPPVFLLFFLKAYSELIDGQMEEMFVDVGSHWPCVIVWLCRNTDKIVSDQAPVALCRCGLKLEEALYDEE
jgi:hypothetical protein